MAFVGRERELVLLARALQAGADGRMSRVAITGSAGIGVTRLLDELIARVAASTAWSSRGAPHHESTRGVPFSALGEARFGRARAAPRRSLSAIVGDAGTTSSRSCPGSRPRLERLGIDCSRTRSKRPTRWPAA